MTKDPRGWSKYWIGCFTCADGRQRKRSTRETNRARALQIAQAWEAAESLSRDGYLTSQEQFRHVVNQSFKRIFGKQADEPTVREWLERWLRSEKGAVSEGSYQRYKGIVAAFLNFLASRAELRLEGLTTDDFLRYRDHLLEGGRAEQTVNMALRKVLKRPFQLAWQEGLIERNPVTAVRFLRGVRAEKAIFSPEQVARLLECADDWEWKILIRLGWFTGARLTDLTRLKWEQIDLAEAAISFVQKKTNTAVKIPIHPELLDALLELPAPKKAAAFLLPSLSQMPSGAKAGLSQAFKRLLLKANIDIGIARERKGPAGHSVSKLSFHSFRHSFTSALANAGVPAELRQLLTGHADSKTHRVYTHHEFEIIRDAVATLGRLPKPDGEGQVQ